jgi:crossover junction endodeoxyribonuclease RusA
MKIELFLPFPPSINSYWTRTRVGMMLSSKGRIYRADSLEEISMQLGQISPIETKTRLHVTIFYYMPDNRIRDIDNYSKGVLDALAHARVVANDSQIDVLHLERGENVRYGCCHVIITENTASIKRFKRL